MTHLSEHATYRTRDGSRKGIRVRPLVGGHIWQVVGAAENSSNRYFSHGGLWSTESDPQDLIEETPSTPSPFSYEACPIGKDGRRRAVTRDGREAVLISDQGLGDLLVGYLAGGTKLLTWKSDGVHYPESGNSYDLLLPPPPKRTVWVNVCEAYGSQEDADAAWNRVKAGNGSWARVNNRAHPIEIDGDAR